MASPTPAPIRATRAGIGLAIKATATMGTAQINDPIPVKG